MRSRGTDAIAIGLLLLVGVALRVAMAYESFWFDEAWSWSLVAQRGNPLDALGFAHDNNHLLNTAWMMALGPDSSALAYRGLSLASGIASIPAIYFAALRWGRAHALCSIALAAVAVPMVWPSAQARGYAPAMLAGVLFYSLFRAEMERPHSARLPALWLTAALGLLAHATFVYVLGAAACWLLVRFVSGDVTLRDALAKGLRAFGIPALFVLALYVGFYSDMRVGGGPTWSRGIVLGQALSSLVGLPSWSRYGPPAGLAAALLVCSGIAALRTDPARSGAFLLGATIVVPGAVIVVLDPEFFYPRYLQVALPFGLLAMGAALGRAIQDGGAWRSGAITLLVALLAAHTAGNLRILATGRDDYAKTVAYMASETRGDEIGVASDHDVRNLVVLRFHARDLAGDKLLRYYKAKQWPVGGTEWYLRHSWATEHPAAVHIRVRDTDYRLARSFEHGHGAGFRWFLYRRSESPTDSREPS